MSDAPDVVRAAAPPIRGIEPVSLGAWAGRIATVVYLPGCNLDCPACPVAYLKPRATAGGTIPVDGVLDAIYSRRRWIEGIVVRGGEPFVHAELFDFLETLAELAIPIRLLTNGTYPDALGRVIEEGLVDEVALELRGPLDAGYAARAGTPVELGAIFRSIELLLAAESGGARVRCEFRIEYDGRALSGDDVLRAARTLTGARRLVLAGTDGVRGELLSLARRAEAWVGRCVVEGIRAAPEASLV